MKTSIFQCITFPDKYEPVQYADITHRVPDFFCEQRSPLLSYEPSRSWSTGLVLFCTSSIQSCQIKFRQQERMYSWKSAWESLQLVLTSWDWYDPRPTSDQLNQTNTIELHSVHAEQITSCNYWKSGKTIFSCKSMANIPKQQKEGRN